MRTQEQIEAELSALDAKFLSINRQYEDCIYSKDSISPEVAKLNKRKAVLEQELNTLLENPYRMPKFELDLIIHIVGNEAGREVIWHQSSGNASRLSSHRKLQAKHTKYTHIWAERFGSFWMNKIAYEGESSSKKLTAWYLENDPENAPEVAR